MNKLLKQKLKLIMPSKNTKINFTNTENNKTKFITLIGQLNKQNTKKSKKNNKENTWKEKKETKRERLWNKPDNNKKN